jgi:hypothetical protein
MIGVRARGARAGTLGYLPFGGRTRPGIQWRSRHSDGDARLRAWRARRAR